MCTNALPVGGNIFLKDHKKRRLETTRVAYCKLRNLDLNNFEKTVSFIPKNPLHTANENPLPEMELFQPWEEPLPLIETDDDKLVINPEAAALLQKIMQPVIVVAIAGTYRQGKSYLMNRLAGKQHGFELGNTIEPKTKGIWIWCRKHPVYSDKVLVLIDTEGLGDPNKLDNKRHDMMIFSLAVLLSNTFVFNAIGKIDQEMIQKLHFVTQITKNITVKSNNMYDEEEYSEYLEYFPAFVLAVRDFTLQLIIEDERTKESKEVTADEYFDSVLKFRKGTTRQILMHNLPREAIRNAFKSHHCFVFTRPVQDETLFPFLEKLPEDELSSKFIEQSNKFCEVVFKISTVKKLQQGQDANGRLLLALTEQYVEAINAGGVPCIESTLEYVTQRENQRIQDEALQKYKNSMDNLPFPVSEEILNDGHAEANDISMNHFRQFSIFDTEEEYFSSFRASLMQEYASYIVRNNEKSREFCINHLDELFAAKLNNDVETGKFAVAGGYKLYEASMNTLMEEYKIRTSGQIMAEDIKQEFIKRCESQRKLIMATDHSMTEKDRECENNRKQAEAARVEYRLKEQEVRVEQERLKQLQDEHEMEIEKLQEEFKHREEKSKKETDELITSRMSEHARLLQEGFDQTAAELQQEIRRLKKRKKNWFSSILNIGGQLLNQFVRALPVRF